MANDWMRKNDAYPPEWCIHYRAMSGPWNGKDFEKVEACEVGVRYDDVKVVTDHLHMPCFFSDMHNPALYGKLHCERMQYPTQEQVERYEIASRQSIEKYMTELKADICPHCHQPIKEYQKIGRCVYASPCGDRLYQGQLPEGKPGRRIGRKSPYEDA